MSFEFHLAHDFGAHLANGDAAARYRVIKIEPHLDRNEAVILDFSGVRNANSSFMNALISGILEKHGDEVLSRLTFKNCGPSLRVFISSAIDLGLLKSSEA